jgi:hypothetical protein
VAKTRRDRRHFRLRRPELEAFEPRVLLSSANVTTRGAAITAKAALPAAVSALPSSLNRGLSPAAAALILQGSAQARLIQVPGPAGTLVDVSFLLGTRRPATTGGELGLFLVNDAAGHIGTLLPGSPGYAAAAARRAVVLFSGAAGVGASATVRLPAGAYFGTYLTQNGSTASFLALNPGNALGRLPRVVVSLPESNPDLFPHVVRPIPNLLGFETLPFGGPLDYHDVLLGLSFRPVDTTPPVVAVASPTSGATLGGAVSVQGTVTDIGLGVASLVARIDAGTFAPVSFDGAGGFSFATGLATDGSSDGPHAVTLVATDKAGNVSAPVTVNFTLATTPANPLETFLAPGALSLVGVSPSAFNPVSAPLTFRLSTGPFGGGAGDVSVKVNGNTVAASGISVAGNMVTVSQPLVDGKNVVSFSAVDADGRPLYLNQTVWAGGHTLTVHLVGEDGKPFTSQADVVALLGDDQSVTATQSTTTGTATFSNLPDRTILVQASAAGNLFGFTGDTGTAGSITLTVKGFKPASTVANNDLSQGTAGWDVGTAPVSIIPHQESVGPAAKAQAGISAAATNNDIQLGTSGEGEQSISRTFTVSPGTTSVTVRYRFVTSEVPGGYFGSKYNDYFRVSIRSQDGGGFVGEGNSMNGLGLAAFDAGGATAWREKTLKVDKAGDTVQVDVAVANVADGLYDSQVVVDFIEQDNKVQPSLAWNKQTGGIDLKYKVLEKDLTDDVQLKVYWANGPAFSNVIGAPIFTYTVPKGTKVGSYGPVHIDGTTLKGAPAGTTHLVVASDETNASPLQDVQVGFGPNANAAVVAGSTIDAIKDALRAAGQASATINSTARSPADQARAMFQNLTNPSHTIAQNIATQHGIYAAPGDAVIDVFAAQVQGLTPAQIQQHAAQIQGAMVQEINNQGPGNVSRHCADPTQLNVVDVGAGAFNNQNGALFVSAIQSDGRVSRLIDERNTNGCYHIELPQ